MTAEMVARWNAIVSERDRGGFEHRVLLGIGVAALRPEHGKVTDYHVSVAEDLGRSERWVRETVRVAGAVKRALDEGLSLPLEICDLAWSSVPAAIVNIRHGRELNWREPPAEPGPAREDPAEEVAALLDELVEVIGRVEGDREREALVRGAVERLEALLPGPGEVVPEVSEPARPKPWEPEVPSEPMVPTPAEPVVPESEAPEAPAPAERPERPTPPGRPQAPSRPAARPARPELGGPGRRPGGPRRR